jgi:hypothetical protein
MISKKNKKLKAGIMAKYVDPNLYVDDDNKSNKLKVVEEEKSTRTNISGMRNFTQIET